MPLTTASALARRARSARALQPGALSLESGAFTRYYQQQTRTFRFGRLWSTCFDPCRRHGASTHKCAEELIRRLSWQKHNVAEDTKERLKRMARTYWSSGEEPWNYWSKGHGWNYCYPGSMSREFEGHDGKSFSPKKTPDNPDGVRPGQNIEDAERAPLEHLLFGDKKAQRPKKQARQTPNRATAASTLSQASSNAEYIIDPITNRKVFKNTSDSTDSTYLTPDKGVEIPIKKYKSQFAPFKAPEPEPSTIFEDGPPPEEELRKYRQKTWEDASKQAPARHYGGYRSDLLDTLNEEHEDVKWHKSDAITSPSAAGSWTHHPDAAEYTDLSRYGPVRAHEPDGKYKVKSESQADQQELKKYGAFRSHEPDGKVAAHDTPSKTDVPKYNSVFAFEPDGKYAAANAMPEVDAAEAAKYTPFLSHEPDGKYAASYTDEPDAAELEKYRKPFLSHEPDGKYAAAAPKVGPDHAELAKYRTPFFSHEPDGKYAPSFVDPKDYNEVELSRYKAFRSHEPDGKYAARDAEAKPDADELKTYGAFRSHEPDGKYAASSTPSDEEKAELGKYKAFRSHEPDGKYAAEAQAAKTEDDTCNHEAFTYEDAEARQLPQETLASNHAPDLEGYRTVKLDGRKESAENSWDDYDPAELRKYQAVRWNEPDGKPAEEQTAGQAIFDYDLKGETPSDVNGKTTFQDLVDKLMAKAAAESDVSNSQAAASSQPQPSETLTGNYVRDFPEDFAKSWSNQIPSSTHSLLSAEQQQSTTTVQPALDRLAKPTTPPASSSERSLYKILVWDPTMQTIETAETTSVVPDSTSPLTPAEVLLRISNPAKFFPHFAPLQAQGFEIVAGSGDVLIFRKVRGPATQEEQKEQGKEEPGKSVTAVNPIDMTGGRRGYDNYSVAAERFASPTGFVNYDLPPENTTSRKPEREEWRGEESAERRGNQEGRADQERWKRASIPRRMAVGAVWLAGLSYSLGVVSEYFRTGGVDGKGPKGLN
ncbi:hypothetical protein VTI74DRAFT_6223 [Chaetomium olivicolor]